MVSGVKLYNKLKPAMSCISILDSPIVSVVMCVFNGELFVGEAVESILGQSFNEFEFIIINDGSTDSTDSILDYYQRKDPRIIICHQENRGLVDSLNRGCSLSRGKYIARMDADDIAINNRLLWQVDFLDEHPEVGVIGGAIEVINTVGQSLVTHRYPVKDSEIKKGLIHGDCPLVHPTVLMRKAVFTEVGGYRKVFVDAEDFDLWLRVAERWKLANLKQVVLKYRRHPDQVSVKKFKRQALSNLAARAAALSRKNVNADTTKLSRRDYASCAK